MKLPFCADMPTAQTGSTLILFCLFVFIKELIPEVTGCGVRGYVGNKVPYFLHVTLIQGNRNKPSVGSEVFTELQEEQHIQRVCV